MKYFIIAISFLFCGLAARSQDTVARENMLSPVVYESFYVLKSNKKVRHGLYIAVYKKATVLAKGEYNNGKRVGQWQFFDATGKLTQVYNYDTREFAMIDQVAKRGIRCTFPEITLAIDVTNRPIPIGGAIYAIIPLIARRDIDEKVRGSLHVGDPPLGINHALTIDTAGILIKHIVTTNVDGKTRTYTINDSDYNDGSPKFTPAKVNGKPQSCELKFKTTFSLGRPSVITDNLTHYY